MARRRHLQRSVSPLLGDKIPASFFRTRAVLIGLVMVLIWVGVFTGREWARRSQVESEIARIQEEIAQIESASRELEETLTVFAQPETIEREARRRLNLARSGETVVVIPDAVEEHTLEDNAVQTPAVVVIERGTGPVANLIAWWSYFFGENL